MEHVEKCTNFTLIFRWKVNVIDYSITVVKKEILSSGSIQHSLDSIIERVFNQIKIDHFEEFTLMFVSDIKKLTYRYYMDQPMEMRQREMLGRFLSEVEIINIVGYQIVYHLLS